MAEVCNGMFRFDGEIAEPSGRPRVIVHPWYGEKWENRYTLWGGSTVVSPNGREKACYDQLVRLAGLPLTRAYVSNLQVLLEGSVGSNLLVFEESRKLKKTAERIAGIRGGKGLYLVPTEVDEHHPQNEDNCDTIRAGIINYFRKFGNPLFAGGQIRVNPRLEEHDCDWSWKWSHCLGNAFSAFLRAGVQGEFIFGCCFAGYDDNSLCFEKTLGANIIPEISDQQT